MKKLQELSRKNSITNVTKSKTCFSKEKIFLKTNVLISENISDRKIKISELIEKFKESAKKRNINRIWVNPDILNWFGDYIVEKLKTKPSYLIRFLKNIPSYETIQANNHLFIFQQYDLGDAINKLTQLIEIDELNETHKTVVLYLQNYKKNNLPYILELYYNNDELYLHVYEVSLYDRHEVGDNTLLDVI